MEKKKSSYIRNHYVSGTMLETAKSKVSAGLDYECRISSLQFMRFTELSATLYWVDSKKEWKKKTLYSWKDLDEGSINWMLNNGVEWEVWL